MLPVHIIVLLAAIQGLSEALPVSRSGHDAVAWLWLEPGRNGPQLETFLHFATASALIFAARRRLSDAGRAGLLALTRPGLFRSSAAAYDAAIVLGALGTSMVSSSLVDIVARYWMTTPVAVGFGLLLTGLLLATTALADATRSEAMLQDKPSMFFALLLGFGQGMSSLPGGSFLGVTLVMASWMGMKNDFALDLALLLSAMGLYTKSLHAMFQGPILPDIPGAALAVAFFTAFLGTTVALRATRFVLEKRALALTACWTVPLGLAILAYSRAFSESLAIATTRPG